MPIPWLLDVATRCIGVLGYQGLFSSSSLVIKIVTGTRSAVIGWHIHGILSIHLSEGCMASSKGTMTLTQRIILCWSLDGRCPQWTFDFNFDSSLCCHCNFCGTHWSVAFWTIVNSYWVFTLFKISVICKRRHNSMSTRSSGCVLDLSHRVAYIFHVLLSSSLSRQKVCWLTDFRSCSVAFTYPITTPTEVSGLLCDRCGPMSIVVTTSNYFFEGSSRSNRCYFEFSNLSHWPGPFLDGNLVEIVWLTVVFCHKVIGQNCYPWCRCGQMLNWLLRIIRILWYSWLWCRCI